MNTYFPSVLSSASFIIGVIVYIIFKKRAAANKVMPAEKVNRQWENSNPGLPHLSSTINVDD